MARCVFLIILSTVLLVSFLAPALSSSFILLTRDQLVSSSDAIIVGAISDLQSVRDENGNINTFIAIKVQRDLFRQILPDTTIYLKEPGGRFEGVSEWGFGAAEFELGENVVVFVKLEPNGFFRVAHMFQGKFALLDSGVLRGGLPDDALILRNQTRRFGRLDEIEQEARDRVAPPLGRFITEMKLDRSEHLIRFSLDGVGDSGPGGVKGETGTTKFYTLCCSGGARWHDFDSGGSVAFYVNPANAPGGTANAMTAVNNAIQAWNNVAGTRIQIVNGGQTSLSGRNFSDNTNVISFGDPQGIIPDPVGCSGTLAITYITFSSSPNKVVNGINFKQLFQADMVFNNGFDCFLADLLNLSEVTGHEMGHAIGLGHSSEDPLETNLVLRDALMYYRAHGDGRGASVRSDDIQAVQVVYPAATANLISGVSVSPFVISPNGDGINDTLTVQFTLSASDVITVEIVDRNGTVIATPLNAVSLGSGVRSVMWNGTTSSGGVANDGMYTFRIRGNVAAAVLGTLGVNNTVPEASKSWFLAEGSTVGFQAYVLVQNPNFSPTTVNFTFFLQDGSTKLYTETVPARTRTTVAIHDPVKAVPGVYSVSTGVQADLPILVERAMYFNGGAGGTDSIGTISTNTNWYFPGNRSLSGDEDFILIVNPSPSSSATVTTTFIFDNQAPLVQSYTVGANSRYTIPVHGITPGVHVSVRLQSSLPIAAERAFYINNRAGGAAGIGAVSQSQTWYFAEGDTSALTSLIPASTFLELFNPGAVTASVTVNYMIEDGSVIPKTYTIPAQRRVSLDASAEIGSNLRFSMEVLSNVPIVAERLMYSGTDVGDSIGSPTTAYVWNLAEGFTAFGYETWVLVSNPGNQSANITMNFLKQDSTSVTQNYSVAPKKRLTVYVNAVPGINPTSVSTQVTSDQPIVVERTMKFSGRLGMHQSMGVRQ